MKKYTAHAILGSLLLGIAANASALPTGMTNITVYDGDSNLQNSYYGMQEDNEVEPGMAISQSWDLEGFESYGQNKLAMIGGFDFRNGVSGYQGANGQLDFRSGDIFIDVNNNHISGGAMATDGNGQQVVTDTFGYDFVLDVNWTGGTYNVYSLNANSQTQTAYYDSNYGSSPWQYVSGGALIGNGTFTYEAALTDAATGFIGGTHYAVSGFDLSFLGNSSFYSHFTMGCGNDNLMGAGHTQVPEPSSLALLALGLVGLRYTRRKAG